MERKLPLLPLTLVLLALSLTACARLSDVRLPFLQPAPAETAAPVRDPAAASPSPTGTPSSTGALTPTPAPTAFVPLEPTSLPSPTASPVPSPEPPAGGVELGDGYWLAPQEGEEFDPDLNVDFRWRAPRLSGPDPAVVAHFNEEVDGFIQAEIEAYRQGMQGIMLEDPGGFLAFDYKVLNAGPGPLSVLVQTSNYSGGAHPVSYHRPFNYDLGSGRFLALEDLFASGALYLDRLSETCMAELETREGMFFPDFAGGADPRPENYAVWNLTPDGLQITFEEYQVAPYAAGPQRVLVPYPTLRELVDPAGPLAALLD